MTYLSLEEIGKTLKFSFSSFLVIVAIKCARREGKMQLKGYK